VLKFVNDKRGGTLIHALVPLNAHADNAFWWQ